MSICVVRKLHKIFGNLPQFVADSLVDYLRRAIEIPANPDALASTRETLRERMRVSSLCDEQGFTRDLEVLFISLLQK